MKKVSILSMQRVVNYGSYMQAYALKSTIESLGASCNFIDIKSGRKIPGISRTPGMYLSKLFYRFFHAGFISAVKAHVNLSKRFKTEFYKDLGLDENSLVGETVVIGSDEVFNFAQATPWGFSEQLYGNIPEAGRVISYAGSFGHTTMEDIIKYDVLKYIKKGLNRQASISVRDFNSKKIVEKITGQMPELHLDPVLIFDFSSLLPNVVGFSKDFLIVYTYPGRIRSKSEINAIKNLANRENLLIISIGFYFPWCDKVLIPHPFEVLSYFKMARYVVTDTFHGSIFSIIMQTPFCTIIRDTNSEKLTALLDIMSLKDRRANESTDIDRLFYKEISFDEAKERIQIERKATKGYLAKNLFNK